MLRVSVNGGQAWAQQHLPVIEAALESALTYAACAQPARPLSFIAEELARAAAKAEPDAEGVTLSERRLERESAAARADEAREASYKERESAFKDREAAFREREVAFREREAHLYERERAVAQREAAVARGASTNGATHPSLGLGHLRGGSSRQLLGGSNRHLLDTSTTREVVGGAYQNPLAAQARARLVPSTVRTSPIQCADGDAYARRKIRSTTCRASSPPFRRQAAPCLSPCWSPRSRRSSRCPTLPSLIVSEQPEAGKACTSRAAVAGVDKVAQRGGSLPHPD